jgi:CRP-like cAMP-binding protein
MALVNDEPRNATVTAVHAVTAYRLALDSWRHIEAFYPGLAARIREIAEERAAQLPI